VSARVNNNNLFVCSVVESRCLVPVTLFIIVLGILFIRCTNVCAFCNGLLKERWRGVEVTGRRGRRRRKLLDDLKETRGYSHLKEEALGRTTWRARFGRGFGPVVGQTTEWMSKCLVANVVTLQMLHLSRELHFFVFHYRIVRNLKGRIILQCTDR
jgi:hypothetical protein